METTVQNNKSESMTFQIISQMIKKNKHPIFKETPFARREKNIESDDSSQDEEKVP